MIIDQLFTRPVFEEAPMASPEQLAYNQLRTQYDSYQTMTGGGGNTAVSRDPAHTAKLAKVPAEIARMAAALKAKGIDAEAQYDALSGPAAAPVDANQAYGSVSEVAPPGDKAERMVKHIKAGYARDGKLTPKEKGIAFATAWKAHNAGQLDEFARGDGPDRGNYLKELARAWYNMDFELLAHIARQGGNPLKHRMDVQETIERMLERGIHCGDGRVRKYYIGYNSDFDGVEIQSHDHYEHSDTDDNGMDIDDRTGKPWGPYDVIEFSGDELDESINEAAQGHTIEAHGVRGMDRRPWHRTFRNADQMTAWAEKYDAEIMGTRDLEQARHGNLSPAEQGVAEGLIEMDKSQPSAGRDTGPRSGPEKIAKPITQEKMVKHALDTLAKSMGKKDDKKKDVKEADTLMNKLRRALVREGRVKELADDLKTMSDADFMKKYGKAKAAIRKDIKRVDEARTDYTPDEMADMLSGKRSQKQIDADAERTRGPNKTPPTKESTQSRAKRLNEKLTTSDPFAFPAAKASSGKAIDDPDIMGSLKSASTPKFDRFSKTGGEPKLDFRAGITGDDETEVEPELIKPDPNPYMQSWGGKYATGGSGEPQWRYVEKGEDPARYGGDTPAATGSADWRSIPAASKSAAAPIALDLTPKPKYKFDRQTLSMKPADGSGANPNIDDATRDRARAWAAQQNAPGAALAGAMRSSGNPVDTAKSKTDWRTIYNLNKAAIGSDPNRIRPGMKLKMPDGSTYAVQSGDTLSKIAAGQINELSTNKLAQYKTAAAKDARQADQAGDFKRGDKRFHGIVQATKKQFDNDAKQVDESRAARRALMAQIVNHR